MSKLSGRDGMIGGKEEMNLRKTDEKLVDWVDLYDGLLLKL